MSWTNSAVGVRRGLAAAEPGLREGFVGGADVCTYACRPASGEECAVRREAPRRKHLCASGLGIGRLLGGLWAAQAQVLGAQEIHLTMEVQGHVPPLSAALAGGLVAAREAVTRRRLRPWRRPSSRPRWAGFTTPTLARAMAAPTPCRFHAPSRRAPPVQRPS
jgi:hypothetical protein